jgi:head-tail adaptor
MALRKRGDGQSVRAGDMDHQVRIKRITQSSDSQGGRTSDGSPVTVATVWANLMPITASRALSYGIPMTNKPHEIDMRYEETDFVITEDDYLEVIATSQVLYVHSVLNVDKRYERTKILAVEKK